MPRRMKVDRPVEKTINLPSSLCAKVDLLLWSELQEKVPFGAWQEYVSGLIEADLTKKALMQASAKHLMENQS